MSAYSFTASTGLRDTISAFLATCYYWVTLHDNTGGFVAGDTYSAGVRGELATVANGYTRGGKSLTLTNTNGVLDGPDEVWNNTSGSPMTAYYAAVWISSNATQTGAKLLSVVGDTDTAQTASNGQTMTAGIANSITITTPA